MTTLLGVGVASITRHSKVIFRKEPSTRGQDPTVHCHDHGVGLVLDTEFPEDSLLVIFHCLPADSEMFRYLVRLPPVPDEAQHLDLAGSERRGPAQRLGVDRRPGSPGCREHAADQHLDALCLVEEVPDADPSGAVGSRAVLLGEKPDEAQVRALPGEDERKPTWVPLPGTDLDHSHIRIESATEMSQGHIVGYDVDIGNFRFKCQK